MQITAKVLPKQYEYIHATTPYAIYCGGWGAGKSVANAALAIKYALEHPGIEILMCAATTPFLRDTVIAEFYRVCPSSLISDRREAPYAEVMIDHGKSGIHSKILFRAFDMEWKAKSFTVGLVVMEEATNVEYDVYLQLQGRLRQIGMPGHIRLATNPDTHDNWVFKEFLAPSKVIEDKDLTVIQTTTFDNILLPESYLDKCRRLEHARPLYYRRNVLGEWGSLDEDSIGAFIKIPKFASQYLVAFLDTSFSDSTVSDRTALCIVGFVADPKKPQNYWGIEFTGKSWQKSVTNTDVIYDMIRFLDRFKPIEVCVESQLGDSTKIFIDRFKQAERDLHISPKNHWTVLHQTKNKHERIMLHVAGNKDRLMCLEDTQEEFLNPIINYTKKADHDDEPDSLAGAINLWQTSKVLRNYLYAVDEARRLGIKV